MAFKWVFTIFNTVNSLLMRQSFVGEDCTIRVKLFIMFQQVSPKKAFIFKSQLQCCILQDVGLDLFKVGSFNGLRRPSFFFSFKELKITCLDLFFFFSFFILQPWKKKTLFPCGGFLKCLKPQILKEFVIAFSFVKMKENLSVTFSSALVWEYL